MISFLNKNDKQHYFNQVRGVIQELNMGEKFCNITLQVGKDSQRNVNLVMKKPLFEELIGKFQIGDRVCSKFYLTSRFKNGRWYTMANLLDCELDKL
jgi:hypothetical protein